MSVTVLRETTPIAKKDHICMLCGCSIPKGQKYRCQTNVYDSVPYLFKCHQECHEVARELDMYFDCEYDEGLTDDFFQDTIAEYIYDNHYDKDAEDISNEWQDLTHYEEVCKILEEMNHSKPETMEKQKTLNTAYKHIYAGAVVVESQTLTPQLEKK